MSFVRRKIRLTFELGEGTFGASGANKVVVEDLRTSVKVTKAGGRAMGNLSLVVHGMALSEMNKLSTLGFIITQQRRNKITVEAGDDTAGMAIVFIGTIRNAWFDGASAPDVGFRVEASNGLYDAIAPADSVSYPQPTDVATIMQSLAQQMGLTFENNGVSVILPPMYFSGSARNQALAAVKAARIQWNGGDNGILSIWPKGGARIGKAAVVSPDTGMIGFPTFTSFGVQLRSIFNPGIGGLGTVVDVQSSLTPANQQWVVTGLDYDLDAEMPNGAWAMTISGTPQGQAAAGATLPVITP